MIGFKQFSRLCLGTAAGGALLLNVGTAYAAADACQAGIEAAAGGYASSILKAASACADAVQKARVANKPLASAAAACEGSLLGVYDAAHQKPPSAASKFRTAMTALGAGPTPKCTDLDLVQLQHQVSGGGTYSSAPGTGLLGFLTDWELLTQESAALQSQVSQVTSTGSACWHMGSST